MKLGAIAFLVLLGLSRVGISEPYPNYVYLGGAWNLQDCARLARDAGFGRATFGGYLNGIYYVNACFGSEPVQSSSQWKANVSSADMATKVLYWEVRNHAGYESLMANVDQMQKSLTSLMAAADDGISKNGAYNLYLDLRESFRNLVRVYYPKQQQLQNVQVARAWNSVSDAMNRLQKDFEGPNSTPIE